MTLYQEGPRDAKVVVVGESPGSQEVASGRPFVGGAGQVLNSMLERTGFQRSKLFITNVCHVQPPDNDFDWFYKKANQGELVKGILQLKKDLEEIKPNLVIALGANPLKIITGKSPIINWRGSVLESAIPKGLKVIGTWHPAYILRVWEYKAVAELDLAKARRECEFPEIRRRPRNFILNPDPTTRAALGREMFAAEYLAVDIECTEQADGTWRLSCVGFSDSPERALVVPILSDADKDFVRWLCGSPNKKVLQNGTFDTIVLRQNGIEIVNFAWDTMIAQHCIYPECASSDDEVSRLTNKGRKKRQSAFQKGLGFLTSVYTDIPYYKDDSKLWKDTGDIEIFWRYNGLDAMSTFEVREGQEKDIAQIGVQSIFDHAMSLVQPLRKATERGILMNTTRRQELRDSVDAEIKRLQLFLDTASGESVNVKSNKQVTGLLYDKLGLPVQYGSSGGRSADADAITRLSERTTNPILHTIIAIRERRDLIERYLDCKIDSDRRMRCSFDITGTRSGRLSSRASIFGSGTNLQNQPEFVRETFVADPGQVLLYADYSQAEARVVACLAEEKELMALFADPSRDVHRENASRIFDKPVDQISDEERYLAKRVIHASNYMMGPEHLVEVVNGDYETTKIRIDLQKAKRLIEAYFALYPNIPGVFWREVENAITSSRTLNTPFGRRRTFYSRLDSSGKLLREAISYIPQSTIGDLCNSAVAKIDADRTLEALGSVFMLAVHDSVLVQCPTDKVMEVSDRVRTLMDIPITIKGKELRVPTDQMVGFNWGKATDKNPNGLVKLSKWNASRAA